MLRFTLDYWTQLQQVYSMSEANNPAAHKAHKPEQGERFEPVATSGAAGSSTVFVAGKALKPRAKGGASGVLLMLLLLVGLAGVGFYTWEQHKAIAVLFGQYNQLIEERKNTQAKLAAEESGRQQVLQTAELMTARVDEQLQSALAALAAQQGRMDALNRELISARLRITDNGDGANQAWMLTEAESLLRFASQRLLLARDVHTATGLFIATDELLRKINDPAVYSVREALALDLAVLQSVTEVDVAGLYARLGALIQRLDGLQVQISNGRANFQDRAQGADEAATPPGWWDSTKASLGQYFVITREIGEAIPQLDAEQTWVLREVLRLNLEQARTALLRSQPELYQASLAQAQAGIEQLMQGADKPALLAELEAVRQLPIVIVVPPVNLALTALQQLQPSGLPTPTEVSP